MRKIRSVIIDDEIANQQVLEGMLIRHCPAVDICGKAQSVDEGYRLIGEVNPDVVFLDIKMPEGNGFDLLKKFKEIDFYVVFVTGYDEYAIQAFEYNALDYILKPIDYEKLIKDVEKLEKKIANQENNNIIHFIHSLEERGNLIKTLSLHHNEKVQVINLSDICLIQAARGYSEIFTTVNQKLLSTKTLTDYEQLLTPFTNFLRVNKSTIVNIDYISEYSKGLICSISLKNWDKEIEISRRKKSSIIQYLKGKL